MRPAGEAETGGKFPQVPGHLGPQMPEEAGRSLQGRSPAQTLISDPGRESVSVFVVRAWCLLSFFLHTISWRVQPSRDLIAFIVCTPSLKME